MATKLRNPRAQPTALMMSDAEVAEHRRAAIAAGRIKPPAVAPQTTVTPDGALVAAKPRNGRDHSDHRERIAGRIADETGLAMCDDAWANRRYVEAYELTGGRRIARSGPAHVTPALARARKTR